MRRRNLHHRFTILSALIVAFLAASPAFSAQNPSIENDERPAAPFEDDENDDEFRRRFYASTGIGFDFSRGDYGEKNIDGKKKDIDAWSVPVFVTLEYEPVTFKLSIPYVIIDGPKDFVVGENNDAVEIGSSTRDGIGDAIASLSYGWFPDQRFVPIVDLKLKVKIPTASDKKGIGTGKTDVTLGFELTEAVGPMSVFAGAGHRFKGGGDYDNIWLTTVGTNLRVGNGVSVGAAYDYREGSGNKTGDSHEIAAFASFGVGEHYRSGPYAIFGLSENAPDWGLGATFTYNF